MKKLVYKHISVKLITNLTNYVAKRIFSGSVKKTKQLETDLEKNIWSKSNYQRLLSYSNLIHP